MMNPLVSIQSSCLHNGQISRFSGKRSTKAAITRFWTVSVNFMRGENMRADENLQREISQSDF
jgi:hypothetical protein